MRAWGRQKQCGYFIIMRSFPLTLLQALDIQYTVGLATDVPVDYIMVGVEVNDGALDGYLDEIEYLLALERPPQVLTTSYGFAEASLPFDLTDDKSTVVE